MSEPKSRNSKGGGLQIAPEISGGGLRVTDDPVVSREGGLRIDESSAPSGLHTDEAGDGARRPAKPAAPPTLKVAFSFTALDIASAEASFSREDRPVTLDLLGLPTDTQRTHLFANQLDPALAAAHVRAFVNRYKDLQAKGAAFAHLKELPRTHPKFAAWMKRLLDVSSARDEDVAAWLVQKALEEIDSALRHKAHEAYHVTNASTDAKEIDFGEWNTICNTARAYGLSPSEAEAAALKACRQVIGDEGWEAPKSTEDHVRAAQEQAKADDKRKRADEAAARRADKERQRVEEENRARALENERLTNERLKREAEERAREADRLAKEAEAERERKQAEKARAEADQAKAKAQLAAREAEQQKLKIQQDREAREIQQAVFTYALRGAGIGAAVALLVALITGVFSDASTIALLEAREDMVAAVPEARIRELCGLGRDLSGKRETLNAELKLRLDAIPLADERAKAKVTAEAVCSAPPAKGPSEAR
jgi:hypothetical protein